MNESEYLKEMGRKIKAVRNEKKISLRELGKLCDLDYGSICRIESGQMNSHFLTIKRIAEKLDVDIREFF